MSTPILRAAAATLAVALCDGAFSQTIQFTDVTTAAGLAGESFDAKTNHGLGAAWIDVNEDGWPDLFTVNGHGSSAHLYLNDKDGTFTRRDDLLPALPNVEMPGAVYADYDNDGDSDLYIITDNEYNDLDGSPIPNPLDGPPNILLKNLFVENGHQLSQPLFVDVAAAAGVDDLAPSPFPSSTGSNYPGYRSITASWIDFDRDGYVDLYVGHWSCTNTGHPALMDKVYRNNGDGTFTDATAAIGLPDGSVPWYLRNNLASIGGHIDQDLWPDLYWAQAQCAASVPPPDQHLDLFWRNSGAGEFVDATQDSPGLGDDSQAAMGITLGDIDLDGDWDMYITDIFGTNLDAPPLGNPLYVNNGNGTFQDNTADLAGVAKDTSWPANFLDADHDGYEDLFVGVATAIGQNIFYRNDGDGTFTDVSATAGVAGTQGFGARGSAIADYDRDGDMDILCVNDNGDRMYLYRNDTVMPARHWLQVELTATESNRDAIGALVKVRAGGKNMMRQVLGGTSAHSQDSLFLHFGLDTETKADRVTVYWPSGRVNVLYDVPADQYVEVIEGPGPIRFYGDACTGGTSYAPSMLVNGDLFPSGQVDVEVCNAFGASSVLVALGVVPTQSPIGPGCDLLVAPVAIVPVGLSAGPGDGTGVWSHSFTIPATATPGTVYLQGFAMHPSIPAGFSATHGTELSISP